GIVACQVGTALAARTERRSLREVGLTSNRLLLWGIAFELVFAAVVVVTPIAAPLGMALPPWDALLLLVPFPLIVWGADELWRARQRARHALANGDGRFARASYSPNAER
ncbi:MAG: cation transporting ATPase C-terminal domain-containing protein, partial [Gaiellaceae bacterium]